MQQKELIALIAACRRKDRRAQKALYDSYAPKMFGVCKRYVHNRSDAEDLLVSGFFKALTLIERYSETEGGSFEAWLRRIIVNECLMFLRQKNVFKNAVELSEVELQAEETIEAELAVQDLRKLMEDLPPGYRAVLNLYAIEGYKHREIAEILGISINTSKSQLLLARRKMKEILLKHNYEAPDRSKVG